jgi:hypothetical protein
MSSLGFYCIKIGGLTEKDIFNVVSPSGLSIDILDTQCVDWMAVTNRSKIHERFVYGHTVFLYESDGYLDSHIAEEICWINDYVEMAHSEREERLIEYFRQIHINLSFIGEYTGKAEG